ncbi:hypothetical protein SRIMM317S_03043 [Streptomyces rimosus subsp. rimosus]
MKTVWDVPDRYVFILRGARYCHNGNIGKGSLPEME